MAHTLSEYESKQLLARAGIPVPDERLARDPDEAARAAAELGLPVALKLCGRSIAHKTERNLVRLGLTTEAQVREQAGSLLAQRRPEDGEVAVLVCKMVSGKREVIAGLVRDPQFGPCVMFGIGGIFAEAISDVAFAAAPLAAHDARELIESLRYRKLLGAFRGEPAADVDALCTVIEGLARIGEAQPEVASIDINPMILQGGTPVVVDALVELREGAA